MITFNYAAQQLTSIWRLAFTFSDQSYGEPKNEDWRNSLDRSVDGVFKSLWAILFAAPFALLTFIALRRAANNIDEIETTPLLEAPLGLMLGVEFLSYVVDWGISIALIIFIARTLNITKTITDTIITYNWAQVYAAGFQSIPIAMMGLMGTSAIAGLLAIPILIVVLIIFWNVFRQAMGLNAGMTIAMIVLLTLVNVIVNSLIAGTANIMLQGPAAG